MPNPVARPASWMHQAWLRGRGLLRGAIAVSLLAASIVLAAWLFLLWGIVPRLDAWRPELEARASQALGLNVRIGAIEALPRERGWAWAPPLQLRDVVLRDGQQRETLRLDRVQAALSPASLLPGWDGRWQWRFARLLIEGAALDVRRALDGRIIVAGFEPREQSAGNPGSAADWFFSQREFAIRHATLRWTDEQRGAVPLLLSQVDLLVRNGVRRHSVQLEATPPTAWGGRFTLRGRFTQPLLSHEPGQAPGLARAGDWRRWDGTLEADLPEMDARSLRAHVDLPVEMLSAQGAMRLRAEVRKATPTSLTAELALRDVVARLSPEAEPLALARLQGSVSARQDGTLRELAVQGFGFTTDDGIDWPAGDARVRWRVEPGPGPSSGELQAQRLDLALLARIAQHLPVPAAWRSELKALEAAGVVQGLTARWDGPLPPAAAASAPAGLPASAAPSGNTGWTLPARYHLEGRVTGLSIAPRPAPPAADGRPRPGRPGIEDAELSFSANEQGGEGRLGLRGGALLAPGVFAQPRVAFDELQTRVQWTFGAQAVELALRDLSFANADAQGKLELAWQRPRDASGPGTLDLRGRLTRVEAARVAAYLPLGIGDTARHYVEHAVQGGQVTDAAVRVQGELREFPFAAPKAGGRGEFNITARVADVTLAYVPHDPMHPEIDWPAFTKVRGELVFDRDAMRLRDVQGRLGGVGSGGFELSGVQGRIEHLAHEPTLVIDGVGRGLLDDALRYVNVSPVGGWLGGVLAQAHANGPAELQLGLTLPLHALATSQVRGVVTLLGNDLRLQLHTPLLGEARGRIAFTEREFALTGGTARVLGGEATLEGERGTDGHWRFSAQGTAAAEALRRESETGPLARYANRLAGQTAYRLGLELVDGRPSWQLTSPLAGLRVDLPAPLGKPAETALPLRVLLPAQGPWDVVLGPDTARLLLAQWQPADGPGPAVGRASLAVGQPLPPLPSAGLRAQLKVGRADLEAWRAVIDGWLAEPAVVGAPASAATGTSVAGAAPMAASAAASTWAANVAASVAPTAAPTPGQSTAPPSTQADAAVAGAASANAGPGSIRVTPGAAVVAARDAATAAGRSATPTMAAGASAPETGAPTAVLGPQAAPASGPRASPGEPAPPSATTAAAGPWPVSVSLRAQQVLTASRTLHEVQADVVRAEGSSTWRAKLQAKELAGDLEYLPPSAGERGSDGAGRLRARLAHLSLPRSDNEAVTQMLDRAPASVPALDIVVDDFVLNGMRLGRLEAEAVNRGSESASREWLLTRFAIANDDGRLQATGRWQPPAAGETRRRAVMDFRLALADSGAMLGRFGQPGVLRAGQGQLDGQVSWLGSPLSIDAPSLAGQVHVALAQGQFLRAEPGVARLLGVLSLQSLPRRLLFDFRDVFDAGFAFDSVNGDVAIDRGVATTRNLRMHGVQAVVLMEGAADLARETQDLHAWIVPEINAGAASLAYAAVNPAIGLGAFVAQWLLRRPLAEANTRELHIGGTWAEPKVEHIERAQQRAPPSEGASAPAPSSSSPLPGPIDAPDAEPAKP